VLRSDDAAAGVVDLSDAVTVFVTTVGAPTLAACMAHLQAQDCRFTLRLIENVAPMNVAFQRMLDECTTPYYVQVDEDMLLDPHAVRTLYERIEATSPRAAMFVATLFDVHLARCIIGVKIYRHDVVRRYPLAMQDSFESDQARRIEADGYPGRARAGHDRARPLATRSACTAPVGPPRSSTSATPSSSAGVFWKRGRSGSRRTRPSSWRASSASRRRRISSR
jgi:hypothetical protein